jgi:small subunit ribosomal protein S18
MSEIKKSKDKVDATLPIDYRNVEYLKKFLTPHARMVSRVRSGLSAKKQRELSLAIKRAREMALLPYVTR